jgi:hypothetical protein
LDINTLAIGHQVFTQQNCPAITEHGEMAELMASIGLSQRIGTVGQGVTSENWRPVSPEAIGIKPQHLCQWLIQHRQPCIPHWQRLLTGEQQLWQPRVGIIKPPPNG